MYGLTEASEKEAEWDWEATQSLLARLRAGDFNGQRVNPARWPCMANGGASCAAVAEAAGLPLSQVEAWEMEDRAAIEAARRASMDAHAAEFAAKRAHADAIEAALDTPDFARVFWEAPVDQAFFFVNRPAVERRVAAALSATAITWGVTPGDLDQALTAESKLNQLGWAHVSWVLTQDPAWKPWVEARLAERAEQARLAQERATAHLAEAQMGRTRAEASMASERGVTLHLREGRQGDLVARWVDGVTIVVRGQHEPGWYRVRCQPVRGRRVWFGEILESDPRPPTRRRR